MNMNDYPRLAEMGVLHPAQISRYSISSLNGIDFLQIVYTRPSGSILPVTRSYEFPRVQQANDKGEDAPSKGDILMTSPAFREAVAELDEILGKKESAKDLAAALLTELQELEAAFEHRSSCLKKLIAEIGKS